MTQRGAGFDIASLRVSVLVGKVVLGQVLVGKVALGQVLVGKVALGQVLVGKVALGQVLVGKVALGQVLVGKVVFGTDFGGQSGSGTGFGGKVALGQVFLPVLWFFQVTIIPPMLHTDSSIYHPCYILFPSQYSGFPQSLSFYQCFTPLQLSASSLNKTIKRRTEPTMSELIIRTQNTPHFV